MRFPVKEGADPTDASTDGASPAQEVLPMTVRSLTERTRLPVGMTVLGILVIATGWFLIEGLPFVLGCAITCAAAAGAIALATSQLRDR